MHILTKSYSYLVIYCCLLFITSTVTAQHPSIGGYHVYYGHLHNHTYNSDGTGSPASAYNYARNIAGLDFLGIADHSDNRNDLDQEEWTDTKNQANAYTTDGVFVAFHGFEWTNDQIGHITVVNSDNFTTVAATPTFYGLLNWLSDKNVVAFFNHPGFADNNGAYSYNSSATPSLKIVGMELWNKTDGFSTYYYNSGRISGDNKGNFDEALTNGWFIGAEGSGDDHSSTWGTAQTYRMAILANNLTKNDLFEALKVRRFYSTMEPDIRLSFKINDNEMGSILPYGNFPIQIQASDGGGDVFTKVVMYDKNHNVVKSWLPGQNSFTINDNINTQPGDYYYIKVLQADSSATSGQAISSPIFITNMKYNGDQSLFIYPDSCVDFHCNFSGGQAPYSYKWSPSFGLDADNIANPTTCLNTDVGYKVTVTDAIGCSLVGKVYVNINHWPADAGKINGSDKVCQGQNSVEYSVPAIANATGYEWNLPEGVSGESSTNLITVNYTYSAVSGNITVRGYNYKGYGDPSSLPINVKQAYSSTEDITICKGETIQWQGKNYSIEGSYTAIYNRHNGCDSILKMNLTVYPTYSFGESKTICEGEKYNWQGNQYEKAGIYTANYQTSNGCDSNYTLTLKVNPVYTFTEHHTICNGEKFFWQGNTYAEEGRYTANYSSNLGCDSSYILYLNVNPFYTFTDHDTICNGDSLYWQGKYYKNEGSYTALYNTINGCDSLFTLNLAVNPTYFYTDDKKICSGEVYSWQGSNYSDSGTYYASYHSIHGCDSIYTLHLGLNPIYSYNDSKTICKGDYYIWQGDSLTQTGHYINEYSSYYGCDSIYEIDITIDSIDLSLTLDGTTITAISNADKYQWLDCDNGLNAITGANAQQFTPLKKGNFAVKLNFNACTDTSNCITIAISDIKENPVNKIIELYPNPVQDELKIEMKDNVENQSFVILNFAGQVIVHGNMVNKIFIDTKNYFPGIYFIKFQNGVIMKFIKNEY